MRQAYDYWQNQPDLNCGRKKRRRETAIFFPHFRIDANPSAGNELQSEFFVDSQDAQSGFRAIQAISEQFASKLLVTEIRSMAADKHWLSPSYDRETVAFHFTWKNDYEIPYLVSLIEDALEPFNFRAHFGKVFNVGLGATQSILLLIICIVLSRTYIRLFYRDVEA